MRYTDSWLRRFPDGSAAYFVVQVRVEEEWRMFVAFTLDRLDLFLAQNRFSFDADEVDEILGRARDGRWEGREFEETSVSLYGHAGHAVSRCRGFAETKLGDALIPPKDREASASNRFCALVTPKCAEYGDDRFPLGIFVLRDAGRFRGWQLTQRREAEFLLNRNRGLIGEENAAACFALVGRSALQIDGTPFPSEFSRGPSGSLLAEDIVLWLETSRVVYGDTLSGKFPTADVFVSRPG